MRFGVRKSDNTDILSPVPLSIEGFPFCVDDQERWPAMCNPGMGSDNNESQPGVPVVDRDAILIGLAARRVRERLHIPRLLNAIRERNDRLSNRRGPSALPTTQAVNVVLNVEDGGHSVILDSMDPGFYARIVPNEVDNSIDAGSSAVAGGPAVPASTEDVHEVFLAPEAEQTAVQALIQLSDGLHVEMVPSGEKSFPYDPIFEVLTPCNIVLVSGRDTDKGLRSTEGIISDQSHSESNGEEGPPQQ